MAQERQATRSPQNLQSMRQETHSGQLTDNGGDGIEQLRLEVAKTAQEKKDMQEEVLK